MNKKRPNTHTEDGCSTWNKLLIIRNKQFSPSFFKFRILNWNANYLLEGDFMAIFSVSNMRIENLIQTDNWWDCPKKAASE